MTLEINVIQNNNNNNNNNNNVPQLNNTEMNL